MKKTSKIQVLENGNANSISKLEDYLWKGVTSKYATISININILKKGITYLMYKRYLFTLPYVLTNF